MKCDCCGSEHSEQSKLSIESKEGGWLILCPSCANMNDFKIACEAVERIRGLGDRIADLEDALKTIAKGCYGAEGCADIARKALGAK